MILRTCAVRASNPNHLGSISIEAIRFSDYFWLGSLWLRIISDLVGVVVYGLHLRLLCLIKLSM